MGTYLKKHFLMKWTVPSSFKFKLNRYIIPSLSQALVIDGVAVLERQSNKILWLTFVQTSLDLYFRHRLKLTDPAPSTCAVPRVEELYLNNPYFISLL